MAFTGRVQRFFGRVLICRTFVTSPRSLSTTSSELRDDRTKIYQAKNSWNNVSPAVAEKVGRNLHLVQDHPLNTIKREIESYFKNRSNARGEMQYLVFDNLSPIVPSKRAFDDLLIETNHVIRKPTDTYYVDKDVVLRPHTSAHQTELLEQKHTAFLVSGDVYRRDEIDASHYPVFHQMEGVRLFPEWKDLSRAEQVARVEADLKDSLAGMAKALFGDVEMRWIDAYFPFTDPSLELEIFFQDEWLEVLGSGVVQQKILRNTGHGEVPGWAFGLGLERLAMVLFGIPDIRLFWSEDTRFISQFKGGKIIRFQPYSKYPPCYKDISFWIHEAFHENDFCDSVRNVAGDLVEKVELIDKFTHSKTGKVSHCYRVTYRSMDRSLTNEEIDEIQDLVRSTATSKLGVILR